MSQMVKRFQFIALGKTFIAPDGTRAKNPAFDVTPNIYVSAIITEKGIARPPFVESLRLLKNLPSMKLT